MAHSEHDIVYLQPVALSYLKIALAVGLIAAATYAGSLISLLLAIAIPAYIIGLIVVAVSHNSKFITTCFFWKY